MRRMENSDGGLVGVKLDKLAWPESIGLRRNSGWEDRPGIRSGCT